jgi:hypothetical protein
MEKGSKFQGGDYSQIVLYQFQYGVGLSNFSSFLNRQFFYLVINPLENA